MPATFTIPTNYQPDWRFYGEIDISKSCAGSLDNHKDNWYVQGMVLTANEDTAGETPILKSMDWSYFDTQGFVKYEHDPDGIPNPKNVIGIPHIRKSLPYGEFIKAKLLPRDDGDVKSGLVEDYARATAALIKSVQQHNEQHPDKQRTIGFSIEGKYLSKSDGKYVGKVVNVVVSPNPIDTKTYASLAKAHNNDMIKSMTTGSAFGTTDQTGGAALRKESLKSDIVSATFNKPNQGARKMKFKNVDEAKEHYLGQGLDEDEAMKKAKELFPDDGDLDNSEDEVEKSMTESRNALQKAIDTIHSLLKSRKGKSDDDDEIEDDLEKSVASDELPTDEDGMIDITPLFEQFTSKVDEVIRKSTSFHDYVESYNTELAKILSAFSESHFHNTEMVKSMNERIESLEKSLEKSSKVIELIGRASGDVSFLNLEQEKVVDEDGGNGKLSKSVILGRMQLGLEKGIVMPHDITLYEMTGQLPSHINVDSLPTN